MTANPEDNAFPIYQSSGRYEACESGLTKREHFAAIAMQGLLASNTPFAANRVAISAVKHADALIAALNDEEIN